MAHLNKQRIIFLGEERLGKKMQGFEKGGVG